MGLPAIYHHARRTEGKVRPRTRASRRGGSRAATFDTPSNGALDSAPMLDMTWVRDHLDEVEKALRSRGGVFDVASVRRLDGERRAALREVETLKARRNTVSGDIARLKKEGKEARSLIDEMRAAGERIKDL